MADDKTKPSTTIYCRPETRVKLDAIAAEMRWSMATTLDMIADAYVDYELNRMPPHKASP